MEASLLWIGYFILEFTPVFPHRCRQTRTHITRNLWETLVLPRLVSSEGGRLGVTAQLALFVGTPSQHNM